MDLDKSDTMKPQLIVNLFKQAVKTFTPKISPEADFPYNLKVLKSLIDQVRAEDVKLDPTFSDTSIWQNKDKAPCTYIEIFQNQNFNMSIFILKPGFTMPLHDHPQMFGLLKVISGDVRVRCFSKMKTSINQSLISSNPKYETFLASTTVNKYCNPESESCFLTPEDSNFHEIEALDSPAAFLDILAPPYSTHLDDSGERQCHYYEVSKEISPNLVQLQEVPLPRTFYCDQAQYMGPVL